MRRKKGNNIFEDFSLDLDKAEFTTHQERLDDLREREIKADKHQYKTNEKFDSSNLSSVLRCLFKNINRDEFRDVMRFIEYYHIGILSKNNDIRIEFADGVMKLEVVDYE